uniref:Secreted protein n=1 Tax=Arundo donax TaxID=35708 RepID=A0A0A9G2S8_ARUDO
MDSNVTRTACLLSLTSLLSQKCVCIVRSSALVEFGQQDSYRIVFVRLPVLLSAFLNAGVD